MSISALNRMMGTAIVAIVVFASLGCGKPDPTQVVSIDGNFEITVYENMKKTNELNDEADIQAANEFKELYVIVLSEPKTDFMIGFTLSDYADLQYDPFVTNVGAPLANPATIKTDAGHKALQYEVHGASDGNKIGFLVTFVDTGSHFHQVLTWTLESRYSTYRETLGKIATSLKPTS